MQIKLLHAVLHDGHRVEAGQTGDIDPDIAMSLIASGAAVAVEEPEASPKVDPKPAPALLPEAGQEDAGDKDATEVKEAKPESTPATDPKTADPNSGKAESETGKKAAKAEGK